MNFDELRNIRATNLLHNIKEMVSLDNMLYAFTVSWFMHLKCQYNTSTTLLKDSVDLG